MAKRRSLSDLQPVPRRSKKSDRTFALVLTILLLLVGVGGLVVGIIEASKLTADGAWPTVSGTVFNAVGNQMRGRRSWDYRVLGDVNYAVDGRNFSIGGQRIQGYNSLAEAEAAASGWNGQTVPVYYDPTNPAIASAVTPVGTLNMTIAFGVAAGGLLVGGASLWGTLRRSRRRSPAARAASASPAARPVNTAAQDKAIKANPRDPAAYLQRGLALHKAGNQDGALKDYERAVKAAPQHADAYRYRAAAYRDQGQHERARQDFDTAIKLNPGNPDYYLRRGQLLDQMGQTQRSIADFTQAIQLAPQNAVLYFERGLSYSKLKRSPEAIADYSTALELDPDYHIAYRTRASLYYQMDDLQAALDDYGDYLLSGEAQRRGDYTAVQKRMEEIKARLSQGAGHY